ncbi:hypothetical protein [Nocardioides sp. AX2bis]|uniref:hypothetical protein n=1 Tax=Nocardioides sp. AX2bis TaxID=2653157 RepID=UPI00135B8A83|nr:hypothetical protein [Nocardioides sp. AX2bis]
MNGLSTRTRRRTRLGAGLAVVVLGASALAGCSGGSEEAADAAPSEDSSASSEESSEATDAPSAEPYLPVPDGVELTPQGSLLGVGDEAVVAYEPRQDRVGVLGITVRELRETTFEESFEGWQLDDRTRASTPYFVDVSVTNEGRTDLGGRPVPLYLLDDANTLIEASTFAGDFEPCPSAPLPKTFAKGDTTRGCLVFLAPEGQELAGVSFRPDQDFDAITWAGDVQQPAGSGGGNQGGGNSGGNQGGGNGGGGNG